MAEIKAPIILSIGGGTITDIQITDPGVIRVFRGSEYFDLTVGASQNQMINSALVNLDQTII